MGIAGRSELGGGSFWVYGDILKKLEMEYATTIGASVRQINPLFNLVEIPAFALGYNWSQSNDDSGKYAANKIKEWVAKAKERAGQIGAQCPGAIVITHITH